MKSGDILPSSRKFLRFRLSKLNLRMILAVTFNIIIFVDCRIRVTALLGYIDLDSYTVESGC